MPTEIKTAKQYIDSLPEDRQKAVSELRKVISKNIPKGFEECIGYGMIGYVIPHSVYPKGYHCNPKLPLPYMNLGSKKNFIVLHHMGVYASKKILDWFVKEYPKHSQSKLDMGKGCIRFKKMDDIPYKLIGELSSKMTAAEWIAICDKYAKK